MDYDEDADGELWAMRNKLISPFPEDILVGVKRPSPKDERRNQEDDEDSLDSISDCSDEEFASPSTHPKTSKSPLKKAKSGDGVVEISDSEDENESDLEVDMRVYSNHPALQKLNQLKMHQLQFAPKPTAKLNFEELEDDEDIDVKAIAADSLRIDSEKNFQSLLKQYGGVATPTKEVSKTVPSVTLSFRPNASFKLQRFNRRVPLNEPLKETFLAICKENLNGIDRAKISFVLDGEAIEDTTSPEDEDLEDGVIIDIEGA